MGSTNSAIKLLKCYIQLFSLIVMYSPCFQHLMVCSTIWMQYAFVTSVYLQFTCCKKCCFLYLLSFHLFACATSTCIALSFLVYSASAAVVHYSCGAAAAVPLQDFYSPYREKWQSLSGLQSQWPSVQSQVDGSSHFILLRRAFTGTLLESASIEVGGEAIDLYCKHTVSLRDHCDS